MNSTFVLPVEPNIDDLGAIVPVGQVKAENRQVDLHAGAKSGDKVGILGSSDGVTFNPVLVTPIAGPAVSLALSVPRASAVFTSRYNYYRTIRLGKAEQGSTLSEVGLVAEDLPSNAPGATMFREVEVDFSEFLGLAAGVQTFSKTVVNAADLPGGTVVLALVGDGANFIAFDDGTAPATTADFGDATYPGGLLDNYDIGNGATGDIEPFLGDIALGNVELVATEDIVFTVTSGRDLNGFTSGHLKVTFVISAPVPF
jgi:hypothetical protein